jgi:hypothetical protein
LPKKYFQDRAGSRVVESRLPPGSKFSILDARLAGRFPFFSEPGVVLEFSVLVSTDKIGVA